MFDRLFCKWLNMNPIPAALTISAFCAVVIGLTYGLVYLFG